METKEQKVKQRIAEAKAKELTTLDLRNCRLGEIPEEVFELTHLEHLLLGAEEKKRWVYGLEVHKGWAWFEKSFYFHNNYIIELPHKIVGLASLKSLDLSFNALWIFPIEITLLKNLATLDLSNNRLSQLPKEIIQLQSLTILYLSNNNLSQLPKEITQLQNLTILYLSNNNLSQLPKEIIQLQNLTTLDLRNNSLSQLPKEITQLQNLTTLYLSNNNLSQLPKEITQLQNLTTLDLSNNSLSQMPGEIIQLQNLTTLDLRNTCLSQLPKEITQLQNLTNLNLSNNNLSQLPKEITQLQNLTTLYLSNNNLSRLPKEIAQLQNLTTLDISYNSFSQLPKEITQLQNLTTLYLRDNSLSQLPKEITQLQNLTTLYLRNTRLSQLPKEITQLQNLTTLYLRNNNLSQLPKEITQLQNLTTLYLSSNNLLQLPKEITQLQNLTTLYLSNNNLSQLPKEITQLQNLTTLDLSNNSLSQMPGEIIQLQNLTTLDLRNTCLSQLPKEITQLQSLTTFDLSYNSFSQLPKEITQLQNLTTFDLSYNSLSQLPKEIAQLQNLTTLDLRNNSLSSLPAEIVRLRKLKALLLDEASITTPPPEIVSEGIPVIFNYFEELEKSKQGKSKQADGVDYIYEAKLLIVGEERAGKTSLMKSLTDPNFNLDDDELTTEGIDIQTWYIPKKQTELEKDFRLNVWDFGGQEIYHATHQFFLSKRSAYLLVTEPRKEVKHDDFYYWLNIIGLSGGSSPVLLIQNKCDQNLEDIPVREYKKSFKNIRGGLERTSCRPDRKATILNLQDVIIEIVKDTELMPHIGTEVPKSWTDVRKELSDKQKQDIQQIKYQDYLNICQKHKMDKEQADFLANFFHDLGIFLHFKDNLKLRKVIFLNNEWVTHGVYKVLDDKTVIKNHGEFSHKDLDRLWQSTAYDGWETEFIELMHEFKICYPLKDKKNHYLAPHRLPKDEPKDLPWNNINNLHFEYSYGFMPKGMLARFIVERYKNICERYQWRYGVLLEMNGTFALLREDYFNRKIVIRLRGRDSRDALAQIRGTFEDIHDDFNNLVVDEMVPCNCIQCRGNDVPYLYLFPTLKRYEEEGIEKIRCDRSLKEIRVRFIIDDTYSRKATQRLDGFQLKQLMEDLQHAYPTKQKLTRMLRTDLNKNLEVISTGNGLEDIIFTVIQTAEAEGWVEDLIAAAS